MKSVRRSQLCKALLVPTSLLTILLYLGVQSTERDVNPAALANIFKYFADNVQPKTQQQKEAQYAIAISVLRAQCTDIHADIQNVFSNKDAKHVKDELRKEQKCVLCTDSRNVIAARPNHTTDEHSEHVLLYPLGESPMEKLLEQADQSSCVVFYSYNSPCVNRCIRGKDNILNGLLNWINSRKNGMNAFVFEEIWKKGSKNNLEEEFLKINAIVPLYRCKRTSDGMECWKCVENNNVATFCLPENK
ncbi:uncharacterized protein LOC132149655 [Carassius carassius]|uniref:uncharacterized protein LOC132149655 n=1 Tax=Carassius carassius TaxID=217509 RepID=UPI0028693054|nr:uncharacterized protein LOC132149655 [Carassius carassius]